MMTTEQKAKYIKYGSYAVVLGIVGYVIYRWKFAFNEKSLENETYDKMLKFLGPTFKLQKQSSNTQYKYQGSSFLSDTIRVGKQDYIIYIRPFTMFTVEGKNKYPNFEYKIKRTFSMWTNKPGTWGKGDKLTFMGTWKLQGDKLSMDFYTPTQTGGLWTPIAKKEVRGKTVTGNSIKEVLEKSSGESVILDALVKFPPK